MNNQLKKPEYFSIFGLIDHLNDFELSAEFLYVNGETKIFSDLNPAKPFFSLENVISATDGKLYFDFWNNSTVKQVEFIMHQNGSLTPEDCVLKCCREIFSNGTYLPASELTELRQNCIVITRNDDGTVSAECKKIGAENSPKAYFNETKTVEFNATEDDILGDIEMDMLIWENYSTGNDEQFVLKKLTEAQNALKGRNANEAKKLCCEAEEFIKQFVEKSCQQTQKYRSKV